MINLFLCGINGRMGQTLVNIIADSNEFNICGGYDLNESHTPSYTVYNDLGKCTKPIDAIIDFSHPSCLNAILDFAVPKNIPVVLSTTGYSEEQIAKINAAALKTAVLFSSNMSLGINLVLNLLKKAVPVLENNFDIEIIEKHHNSKIDAPSGTALTIAETINTSLSEKYEYQYDRHTIREKRKKKEIGIHSIRGGTIVGEHSVIFAGNDEIIEINHTALSKKVLAVGALNAAKFLIGKQPGLYSMDQLIGSKT